MTKCLLSALALIAVMSCVNVTFAQEATTTTVSVVDAISTAVPESTLSALPQHLEVNVTQEVVPPTVQSVSVEVTADPELTNLENDLTAYLSETSNVTSTTLSDYENAMRDRYKKEQTINLKTVILGTLANDKSIKLSGYNVRTAIQNIIASESIYDLNTYASVMVSDSETPVTAYENAVTEEGRTIFKLLQEQYALNAGMSQLLASGGVVSWQVSYDKQTTNNTGYVSPSWYSGTGVSISQPLLKGFGRDVTEYGIRVANLERCISNQAMRQTVITELGNALMAYYDLVQANATVLVQRIALAQANELLRVNQAKYKADILPQLDVLQAQAELSSREQNIVSALQSTGNASDVLLNYIGNLLDMKDVALVPQDMPSLPAYEIDEEQFLADARRYNPTYLQTLINMSIANETQRYAYNQLMPNLTANASVTAAGGGHDPAAPIDGVLDNKYTSWNAGLSWNFPLQNRAASAAFESSNINVARTEEQRAQTELVLFQNIRAGIRAAQAAYAKTQFGKSSVEYNTQKVSDGVKRQSVGLATSYDVLQFEQDLANARITLIQSLCAYNKSIIQLEMLKGTLLKRLCVTPCGDMVLVNSASVPDRPFKKN